MKSEDLPGIGKAPTALDECFQRAAGSPASGSAANATTLQMQHHGRAGFVELGSGIVSVSGIQIQMEKKGDQMKAG